MKKRIFHRIIDDGILPPRGIEKVLRAIKMPSSQDNSKLVLRAEYRGFPYAVSRKTFKYTYSHSMSFYESHLEGLPLPVYTNWAVTSAVRSVSTYLIHSACGIGISNPKFRWVIVSIDDVPTNEPESFPILFDIQKNQQVPIIRVENEEGVTGIIKKTENVYDFLVKHKEGFEKALKIIDKEYPYKNGESDALMDRFVNECRLDFIKLQRRPRARLTTPKRHRELMKRQS